MGLLNYTPGAVGSLLSRMEDTKRRLGSGLLAPPDAFQLPQQDAPPVAPLLAPPAPSTAFPVAADPMANVANANVSDLADPTHTHRKGIRGGLLHALGADRVQPELAALLTPDQQKRVKPGLLGTIWTAAAYGAGPRELMQYRAQNMLGLQDEAASRKSAAEMARQRALIAADYATMPTDPVQRFAALTEMTGRLAAIGHPDAVKYANILNAIKPDAPKEFAPTRPTYKAVQLEDGTWTSINEATGLDPQGNPVRGVVPRNPNTDRPRRQLTQIPQADGTIKYKWLTEGEEAVGVKPESQQGQALPSVAIEKMIALDDAISAAEAAISAMGSAKSAGANVSGRIGGLLPVPGWVRNQFGQGGEIGRSARSKIGNLTSMIGNLRSGCGFRHNRPPVPVQFGHAFRSNAASASGPFRPATSRMMESVG